MPPQIRDIRNIASRSRGWGENTHCMGGTTRKLDRRAARNWDEGGIEEASVG